MKRLRHIVLPFVTLLAAAALADSRTVTIYSEPLQASSNRGYAIVEHEERLELVSGRNALQMQGVPRQIVATSVEFQSLRDPVGTRLLDLVYGDPNFGSSPRPMPEHMLNLGSLPRPAHTLTWNISAEQAGTHPVRYRYETGGLGWKASYNATVSEEGKACSLRLNGWVELANTSGGDLTGARGRLVASSDSRTGGGSCNSSAFPCAEYRDEFRRTRTYASDAVFALEGPLQLRNGETRSLQFLPTTRDIACTVRLTYAAQTAPSPEAARRGPIVDRNLGHDTGTAVVRAHAQFVNDKQAGGGFLPAGMVSVRQGGSAGSHGDVVVGPFTPVPLGQTVRLGLRNAEDLTGERRQVGFRHERDERWMEEDLEVTLLNRRAHPVDVTVVERFTRWRTWGVIRKSHDYVGSGDQAVEFPVSVPPQGQTVVRYTVRYTW